MGEKQQRGKIVKRGVAVLPVNIFQPFMTTFFFYKLIPWFSCDINCSHSARQMNVLYSTEKRVDHLVQQPYWGVAPKCKLERISQLDNFG